VVVVPTNVKDAALVEARKRLLRNWRQQDMMCCSTTAMKAGVKFKDADLVGIPYRVNVGKKLAEGKVEVWSAQKRIRSKLQWPRR